MSEPLRASLEPQFGIDFSDVRLHTDAEANMLSQQLGANAFTTGRDVFFREGAYQPNSESGKRLLAHELTHVVQQTGVQLQPNKTSRKLSPPTLKNSIPTIQRMLPTSDELKNQVRQPKEGYFKDKAYKALLKALDQYHKAKGDEQKMKLL